MHLPKPQLWLDHSFAPESGWKCWTYLPGLPGPHLLFFPSPVCQSNQTVAWKSTIICVIWSVWRMRHARCSSLCVYCPCCLSLHPMHLCLLRSWHFLKAPFSMKPARIPLLCAASVLWTSLPQHTGHNSWYQACEFRALLCHEPHGSREQSYSFLPKEPSRLSSQNRHWVQ